MFGAVLTRRRRDGTLRMCGTVKFAMSTAPNVHVEWTKAVVGGGDGRRARPAQEY